MQYGARARAAFGGGALVCCLDDFPPFTILNESAAFGLIVQAVLRTLGCWEAEN
jgi:hypothetical protein